MCRLPAALVALFMLCPGSAADRPVRVTTSDAACAAVATVPTAGHQVFAHRGASGYLPEHSLPAKTMAHAQGADFLELDVVLTKDDVPVVLHDVHLDALTDVARCFPDRKRADGRYYAIDFTLAEIKEFQATQGFAPETGEAAQPGRFPLDGYAYRLPTLEEEVRFVKGLNASTRREIGLFVEVKQPTFHRREGRDVARAVFDVLIRHGYGADKESACWVQCFERTTLDRFRNEFGWGGRVMLIFAARRAAADGTDYDRLATSEGLEESAGVVDGVFPNLDRIVGRARRNPGERLHPRRPPRRPAGRHRRRPPRRLVPELPVRRCAPRRPSSQLPASTTSARTSRPLRLLDPGSAIVPRRTDRKRPGVASSRAGVRVDGDSLVDRTEQKATVRILAMMTANRVHAAPRRSRSTGAASAARAGAVGRPATDDGDRPGTVGRRGIPFGRDHTGRRGRAGHVHAAAGREVVPPARGSAGPAGAAAAAVAGLRDRAREHHGRGEGEDTEIETPHGSPFHV